MLRSKKTIIWIVAIISTCMLVLAVFLYLNSTHYKVFKIEIEWGVDLPNHMQLEYHDHEVHIDGSVRYYVFTTQAPPLDTMFIMDDAIDKETFEGGFDLALEGFGVASGKPNIPIEYIPNFNEDYEFLVLSGVTSNRFKFLYLIYQPSTQRIYICHQITQFNHLM